MVKGRKVVSAEIRFVLVQDVVVCDIEVSELGGGKNDSFVPENSKT